MFRIIRKKSCVFIRNKGSNEMENYSFPITILTLNITNSTVQKISFFIPRGIRFTLDVFNT